MTTGGRTPTEIVTNPPIDAAGRPRPRRIRDKEPAPETNDDLRPMPVNPGRQEVVPAVEDCVHPGGFNDLLRVPVPHTAPDARPTTAVLAESETVPPVAEDFRATHIGKDRTEQVPPVVVVARPTAVPDWLS